MPPRAAIERPKRSNGASVAAGRPPRPFATFCTVFDGTVPELAEHGDGDLDKAFTKLTHGATALT